MEYTSWEEEIIRTLEEKLECTTSDAQSIMDAQEFILSQSWALGLSGDETADKIIKSSDNNQ